MSREWSKLRSWNGSQEKAFEELCCQLAAAEQMPEGSKFTRKGTPDAGVECFWTLPNGDELAWQTKFFFQLQATQWKQLDLSVQQALAKHPRLVRYCVCLPMDLADPRLVDKKTNRQVKSARNVWDQRVKKWEQRAARPGAQVAFEYWGDHEIWLRLAKNEHRGRILFWFKEQWFSDDWLNRRVDEACSNAGKRYIPELHVELEVQGAFEALGRTGQFFFRLAELIGGVRREFDRSSIGRLGGTSVTASAEQLHASLHKLMSLLPTMGPYFGPLPFADASRLAKQAAGLAFQLATGLRQLAAASEPDPGHPAEPCSFEYDHLHSLQDRLADLQEFLDSPEAVVANTGALLLVGDAGTGKTHLLCETARSRARSSQPTILFLAQQFVPGEPWSQMLRILGLNCDRDEFLGALDAIAEARGTRTLILIDALNEDDGWDTWPKHLPAMLAELKHHARIGLAVSVRTSYESLVIPKSATVDDGFVRFVHCGFQGHEEESVDRYFKHYGIELPSFPILDPEFSNPLFLRVLCESVQDRGLHRIPTGLRGFSAVFQFFLDSVNEKLARPNHLDYDAQCHIVMQAITGLIEKMVASETDYLPRDVAAGILEKVLPRTGFDKSLFRHLLDEGVLTAEVIPVRHQSQEKPRRVAPINIPVVRFQYQRFADYLIVQYLLEPYLADRRPENAFAAGKPLGRIFGDPRLCRRCQGLIEALAVLIPEKTGWDLPALVPACRLFPSVKHAVSQSLVWRRASSISPGTWVYIKQAILPDTGARESFLRTMVLVAPDPEHPYNARFLHDWLFPMRMVDRDALWSTFLGYEHARGGVVARVLRWAESIAHTPRPDGLDSRARGLAALLLTWFLTSSSRVLRDRATKALVGLLSGHLSLAAELLDTFSSVNDDYVLERLAAAAYGAAMRCQDADAVGGIAAACYAQFFERRRPPTNALTRDYLRGIVELGIHLKTLTGIDASTARPPYRAPLPNGFDPSTVALELDWQSMEGKPIGLKAAYGSVTNHDFSWYVLRQLCGKFLSDHQKDVFRRGVRPYVNEGSPGSAKSHIGLGAAQKFVLDYVQSNGWRRELDDFDRSSVVSSSQMENRVERIGKKYQWIAFYNLIGVLADNCRCVGDGYDSVGTYHGPWQIPYARNIDPSLLIRSKPNDDSGKLCWWAPKAYCQWAENLDELEWLKQESDLPAVDEDFLIVKDEAQNDWFVLEGHYEWTQPTSAGRKHFEVPQRQVLYTVTSCLVRAGTGSAVLKSVSRSHLPRPHFLEPRGAGDAFLGEMHWAPVYLSQLRPYNGYDGWSKGSLPHRVLVTTEHYCAEAGSYDQSMDASVTLVCPSHWIVEKMGLKWNGVEGEWCGGTPGRTIFRDPSAHALGPRALLGSRKDLERLMADEHCEILWLVSGTKWVIGGGWKRKPVGRRLISGALRRDHGSFMGKVRSWLETPTEQAEDRERCQGGPVVLRRPQDAAPARPGTPVRTRRSRRP